MSFKSWSETNGKALKTLKPSFELRGWSELSEKEKNIMLQTFVNKGWFDAQYGNKTLSTILTLNEKFRVQSYGSRTLAHGGPHFYERFAGQNPCCYAPAQEDFFKIFLEEDSDVVIEMLSIYAGELSKEHFGNFKNLFNDISNQFSLNISITAEMFIFKQDEKITKEIYEPVLSFLEDKKWEPINNDLGDAFSDYLKESPDYSSSITHAISALEGFLQILINGKTGGTKLQELIKTADKRGILGKSDLTKNLLLNVSSSLTRERQSAGDAHPKERCADEKSAKLTLNLIMIAMQALIQE